MVLVHVHFIFTSILPGLPGMVRLSNVCNVAGQNARVSVRTVLALIDAIPLDRRAG
ncbi:unnamed protein product [Anisakis simplex]|uniref:Protein of unassigned function n=1 Tax=Anisakis simplex TaxID=6269 RepID=A0A0M3JIX2_ANISI|nr:unnamed protein product [Anisakis simplex]